MKSQQSVCISLFSRSLLENNFEANYSFEDKNYHLRILDTSSNDSYMDILHEKVQPLPLSFAHF